MGLDDFRRSDALRRYAVLDTPPEPNFDRITRIAAGIFEVPICTLALADRDRHFLKSRLGVEASEIPRARSFCDVTVRRDAVFVVPDACADERFSDAPLVSGAPHIRFYAGAPLVTPSGCRVGSLCVLDTTARDSFGEDSRHVLADLAATAVELLEARARAVELARCTDEIAHLARHDPLTGLPNRRYLVEAADEAIARLRPAESVALLYLDLDGFKLVNDRLGHLAGDALLRLVAERLRQALPEGTLLARLGGDEFVALMTKPATSEAAAALARRFIAAVEAPCRLGGTIAGVGVSVGIAVGPRGTGLERLLRDADRALYAAKSAGKGQFAMAAAPIEAAVA